ncbi:MAG TPA: hypothetical protein PLF40_10045, partial [Kofleriaceae bacterium]|nr:hypothetical protein [Kofleriaceae bacterium]
EHCTEQQSGESSDMNGRFHEWAPVGTNGEGSKVMNYCAHVVPSDKVSLVFPKFFNNSTLLLKGSQAATPKFEE